MKAISPALPMTAPSRQSSGSDTSADDEVFGALIAAVIGPSATGSVTPSRPRADDTTSRVDRPDDARRAAAGARPEQAADKRGDDDASQPDSVASHDQDHSANQADNASQLASPTAAKPSDAAKIPAKLAKAAAALAHALAKASDGSAKPAGGQEASARAAAPTQLTAPAGSALTEGQLPSQLIPVASSAHDMARPAVAAALGTPIGADTAKKAAAADPAPTAATPPTAPLSTAQPPTAPAPAPQPDATTNARTPASSHPSVATPQPGPAQASSAALASAAVAAAPTGAGDQPAADAKPGAPDRSTAADGTSSLATQLPQAAQMTAPAQPLAMNTPQPQLPPPPQPPYPSGAVAQQVIQVVAPLRSAKDGDYTLSLQLHPAELGAVTVRVEVQQGVLSVHLAADHAHGHEALSQSLADLRTQLQSSGVRTGDIAVVAAKQSFAPAHHDQQHQTGSRHPQQPPLRDDAGGERRPRDHTPRRPTARAVDDNLDVRI